MFMQTDSDLVRLTCQGNKAAFGVLVERYMPMIHEYWGLHLLERRPSEYLKERNYWGTLHDPVGIKRRDVLGADKILWASDFAHAASDWPRSREIVEQDFAGVPDDQRRMMLAGNAIRFFHLDE